MTLLLFKRAIYLTAFTIIFTIVSCEEEELVPSITTISPVQGSSGSNVTLTGINFNTKLNNNTVTFNGKRAVILSATSTTLVVTAPSSTTGPVVVKTSGGNADGPIFTYLSGSKEVLSFAVDNTHGTISGQDIIVSLPAGTDVSALSPLINVSEQATLSPASGTIQDFRQPVTYTVTAEDGSQREFHVQIVFVYGLTNLRLKSGDAAFEGVLDHVNHEVVIKISYFNIRSRIEAFNIPLTLETVLLPGYEASSPNGSIVDIDGPGAILITANSGAKWAYALRIKNTDNFISGFYLLGLGGFSLGYSGYQIYPEDAEGLPPDRFVVHVLSTLDRSALIPYRINIAERSTIAPLATTPRNFNGDVNYVVTSEAGVAKTYTIRVIPKEVLMTNDNPVNSSSIQANGDPFWEVYQSISPIVDAELVNLETGAIVDCTINTTTNEENKYLYVYPSGAFPVGVYNLVVALANGNKVRIRSRINAQ